MEEDWLILAFKKLESSSQHRDIMAINRPVITESEFFENHAGDEKIFDALLDFVSEVKRSFARDRLDEAACFLVQMGVGRIRRRYYSGRSQSRQRSSRWTIRYRSGPR